MRGKQYLTKREQFTNVYDNGASWVDRLVVLKILRNGKDISRYGFSISSRVGGAVVRNRVKRRLREILRDMPLKTGWDIVIIARPPAAKTNYHHIGNSVRALLNKARLLKTDSISDEAG